jgi:hypothetical protein
MTLRTLAGSALLLLLSSSAASAQHFPLKQGEWEGKTSAAGQQPMTLLFCFNDEMWVKGLTQNPACSITQLSVTGSGASYNVNCPMKSVQMKGSVSLTFDGLTHMSGKGSFDTTVNGNASHMDTQVDYVWKQSACSPNDMNMRQHPAH